MPADLIQHCSQAIFVQILFQALVGMNLNYGTLCLVGELIERQQQVSDQN